MEASYGFLSIVPLLLMIISAIVTKRIIESAILATLVAFVITDKWNFFFAWVDGLQAEVANFAYFFVLFCSIGALIKLVIKSNSIQGFAQICTRFIKGRKSALLVTWIAGIIIFADDYLNALGVGTSMRAITDKYRVSREFLSYVVNSTGAVVCMLVPVSSWGAFLVSQIDLYPVTGNSMADFISSMPYMFYCWAALLIVPLFIFGVIPLFGKMKKAERRAIETGEVFPASGKKSDYAESADLAENAQKVGKARDFIIPMLVFVVLGIIWGNIPYAGVVAIAVCALLYLPTKTLTPGEFFDAVIEGCKDMVFVIVLLVFVFLVATCGNNMGASDYIISIIGPLMLPKLLPFATFLGVSLLAIGTGSFWGSAAIALPIFLQLCNAGGGNPYVVFGAAASAIALASHISFWNDGVTVTCAACEIDNADYSATVTPLLCIPIALACIGYLVLGFVM